MIKIIFEGNPQISQISLPLLIYHPMQIILGSVLVPSLKNWLLDDDKHRLPTKRMSVQLQDVDAAPFKDKGFEQQRARRTSSRAESPSPSPTRVASNPLI